MDIYINILNLLKVDIINIFTSTIEFYKNVFKKMAIVFFFLLDSYKKLLNATFIFIQTA